MDNFIVSVRCITPVLLVMSLGLFIRSRKLVPEETYDLSTMTLVALGASLRLDGMRKNFRRAVLCSAHRLLLAPLVMVTAACLLGFRDNDLGVILICAGAPTAASSYPMALACDSDHELTAQVVVSTSMFFCLTMLLWIFGLKQLGLM